MTPSAEEAIHMRDQKNKQMFITGLWCRNDCLFDVCAARLGCLGFRPQCEPTASLSGLKSRQLATQQMRWIMLIHGGELGENVCFTLQHVCAHVYWCLSKWDCGLISPRQAPSVIYKLQSGRPQMCRVIGYGSAVWMGQPSLDHLSRLFMFWQHCFTGLCLVSLKVKCPCTVSGNYYTLEKKIIFN